MKEYEKCECIDGHIGHCLGPAVFEVTRKGKQIKLCTRCDLVEDMPTRKLIIDQTYPAAELMEYDSLGAMIIMGELSEPE